MIEFPPQISQEEYLKSSSHMIRLKNSRQIIEKNNE